MKMTWVPSPWMLMLMLPNLEFWQGLRKNLWSLYLEEAKYPQIGRQPPDKKMTPTKKKMTAKIKNSPVAMNVANRLGLKNLPNVKMMAERLQRTHLPPAQNEAKYKFFKVTKPIIISSSFGEQKPGCTPVNWASQPMGGKLGQRTGVQAADGPIGAGEEPE